MKMWQADPNTLAAEISGHFGLHLEGSAGRSERGEFYIDLAPVGIHPNESFRLRLELGWRTLHAVFIPGSFASHLISAMGSALPVGRVVFSRIAEKCLADNARLNITVNGVDISPVDSTLWPETWQSFDLSLHKTPLAINTEDYSENDRHLSLWAKRFAGLVLSLVPLEEDEEGSEVNPDGLPEGAATRILANRYERSYANRMSCLEILGYSCLACGFNFEQIYGAIGEGFIHVHHVTPVSQIGPGYIVSPSTDLVPLCPNCHAMAHRATPPLTVEQLKKLLAPASQ